MKNSRFIVITGMDGSGKTTLANWLYKYFISKGYKSKYVWIKSNHTFAYLLSCVLISLGRYRIFRNPKGVMQYRIITSEGMFIRKIWPFIEFISVLPLIIFKVKIPLLLGYRIVCDRYTIDTIVSVTLYTRNMNFLNSILGKILLKMIPKESTIILLDADYLTVLKRRPDIEYTENEIKKGIRIYRTLSRKLNMFSIDVQTHTIEQVRNRVINILFTKSMPCSRDLFC